MDLDRADLQVVVWEADDAALKLALRMGVDMHCMNAVDIYRIKGIPIDELVESHPNYPERRGQIGYERRQAAKTGVHAVDYACKERTLAIALGSTVKEAAKFIDDWFAAHPGIKRWHERTEAQLHTKHCVENRYGYRRFYFDRVEGMLPEALAWVPQSTVAITINKIWHNIYHHLPEVQVLLQVHDSLAGQFPRGYPIANILPYTRIQIPYEDPLIIPVGFKTSDVSWGDCQ
jgi:DNA polymerase I-like protein with 3'-5' exonuclease and polymerase domains